METIRDLDLARSNCIRYLLNNIREDGSFVYKQNLKTGLVLPGYNILRHAGALYVLFQSLQPGEQTRPTDPLEKSVAYLTTYLHPLKGAPAICCIVEADEVKLGGTALALLAFIERYKTHPDKESLERMRKMASFLVWMQEPSGKYKSKLMFESGSLSPFQSTYYPGEAILALTRLHEIDPDPAWLDSAALGADYLLKNPVKDNTFQRGHNHWFAIALSELYFRLPKKEYYEETCLITDCTVQSVYLHLQELSDPQNKIKPLSSAAMATRGETVLACLVMGIKSENFQDITTLPGALKEILNYCLSLQVDTSGNQFPDRFTGGIRKSTTNSSIRIDYVQHVLSLILGSRWVETALKRTGSSPAVVRSG